MTRGMKAELERGGFEGMTEMCFYLQMRMPLHKIEELARLALSVATNDKEKEIALASISLIQAYKACSRSKCKGGKV